MSRVYQRADGHFIDYEVYELPGVNGVFRGPPIDSDEYLACVGAAQTFGRFVQMPFPKLISRALGINVLNLGRGGAGPTFPLSNLRLMEYINRAKIVIVQVLSGRSQSNSLFRTVGHGMYGINLVDGREISADQFYTWLLSQDAQLAHKIVAETRENYVSAMTELLDAIEPPKILLWFSVRRAEYEERWELPLERLWGEFPQFVNQAMLDRLRSHSNLYVECVSRRGSPQPLFDRNGNPTSFKAFSLSSAEGVMKTENRYYPSPEMHEDAAELLIPACRKLLRGNGG
ncbi:MAG TPA: DUF6473 family protein [Candidatus Sulfotelmatobacter sp.]|nr:DUF6473 family protein [Candidatus Sulfotelmatobacter sp.]